VLYKCYALPLRHTGFQVSNQYVWKKVDENFVLLELYTNISFTMKEAFVCLLLGRLIHRHTFMTGPQVRGRCVGPECSRQPIVAASASYYPR
jgi:hypothetical protein